MLLAKRGIKIPGVKAKKESRTRAWGIWCRERQTVVLFLRGRRGFYRMAAWTVIVTGELGGTLLTTLVGIRLSLIGGTMMERATEGEDDAELTPRSPGDIMLGSTNVYITSGLPGIIMNITFAFQLSQKYVLPYFRMQRILLSGGLFIL